MRHLYRFLIITIFISLPHLLPTPAHPMEPPPLKGRVNDYAGMLSPETARNIEQQLAGNEQETTNQVVLLTVPSLEGETIEGLAIKVGDSWKIGQKGKDNGVLLLLAKKERKIRIEVGPGLQGVLPDITAGQIIRNIIAPQLRSGNTDRGISDGLAAIISATKGEFKATAADRSKKGKGGSFNSLMTALGVAFIAVLFTAMISGKLSTITGAIALPMVVDSSIGASHGVLLFLGLLGGIAGLLLSLLLKGLTGGGGGGFGGPGIFYGGGGGSSSSSDSFSGGGGGFDGGGASDDW